MASKTEGAADVTDGNPSIRAAGRMSGNVPKSMDAHPGRPMSRFKGLIAVLVGLAVLQPLNADTPDTSGARHVLIVAKPRSIRYVGEPSQRSADAIFAGSLYKVKLTDVQVIYGEVPLPRVLEVELTAVDKGALTSKAEIYVLMEINGHLKPHVLDWTGPRIAVCLPGGLIKGTELEKEFTDSGPTRVCSYVPSH